MKRIAIDVGHANGTGARGFVDEHEMCATLAVEVKNILESFKVDTFQADIIDFPEKTNSADLTASVKAINAGGYDACVSLHMDAAYKTIEEIDDEGDLFFRYEVNPTARGAHACYYSKKGKRLAREIARRLCLYLPGRAEQVVERTDLYFLKKTRPVACLVECGFCTNPRDSEWVNTHPHEVARSIALGIAAYLEDYNESL